jgi:hypothetical protein
MGQDPPDVSANHAVAAAAPFLFGVHFLAELLSFVGPLAGLWWAFRQGRFVLFVAWAVVSVIYVYPLTLLMAFGLLIRWCPKPRPGVLRTTGNAFSYFVLAGLSRGATTANCAFWLSCLPYPAHWFYRLAGSRIHPSVFIAFPNVLPDPWNVEIGRGCILGQGSIVAGHVHVQGRIFLAKTHLGTDVLVGANAAISGGVQVGDGARINPNSFLPPGTRVPPGEVWGGSPAQKLESPPPNHR